MNRQQKLDVIGEFITDYVNISDVETLTDSELNEIIEELKEYNLI